MGFVRFTGPILTFLARNSYIWDFRCYNGFQMDSMRYIFPKMHLFKYLDSRETWKYNLVCFCWVLSLYLARFWSKMVIFAIWNPQNIP